VVVGAEPRRRTERGGRRSGLLGGTWLERSHGTGWSPEQSSMEIERERRALEQVRRRGGERDKDIVWIRRRGGDFFGASMLFKISFTC
jgi:hypothetical protein